MSHRIILIVTSFFLFTFSYSQSKQQNLLNEAIDLYGLGQMNDAYKVLEDCIARYPGFDQALFVRANWSILNKKYDDALPYLEKLDAVNPSFNPLQKRMLAECYFDIRNFAKAKKYAEDFLDIEGLSAPSKKYGTQLLRNIEFVQQQPKENFDVVYKNIGREINSGYGEYFPSTNADESAIYFTRRNKEGEDIWVSFNQDGQWTPAILLDEPEMENERYYVSINTFDNDGAHTISPGGRHLFFTSCQRPGGLGSCDLYMASKKGNEWGKPKILPTINTKGWESQPCISADSRKLFFVSSRDGGIGGIDIYMSELTADGFSTPINLGSKINTEGDEDRPFIHPDGRTLYFSSDGHAGYGGKDLFMSRWENGEWQTPINLGGQINSTADEISIFINALGTQAYIAKQNTSDNRRDFDIYTFKMPEKYKPQRVTYLKGIVVNAKTNEPLKASIKLTDIELGKQITSLNSDDKSGDFLLTLTADKEYGFAVMKEGFAFYSQNYSFDASASNLEPEILQIKLMPLESGTKFELRNVFFETAKFDLKATSYNELNYVLELLKANPNLKIIIGGHTDNVGNATNNQILSENRAKAVMDYLIQKGIAADRLSAKGYGATKPIESNETETGRAKNRRTEIEIL